MIGWAVETFVATTLLMLLVLGLRSPVRKVFGPGIAYALWLLPVFRLLMPPLPESWREQAAAPVTAASDVIVYYVVEPLGAAPEAAAQGSFGLPMAIFLLWAVGAAGFLGFHLVSHSRFCAKLLRKARVDRTVAEGKVRVIETDAAHGPLAFGIWRKYVAFPRDFAERYDEQERALALAHELGHHVRGDLIANWVALFVLAIHWFNPVAWKAFRAFRADQEMACDALVLAGREAALRHAYGRAIVKSAHGGAVSAACHLHTINELKGRLRMLSKTRKNSPIHLAGGMIGVSALSLVALGLTASGSQAAERIKSNVEAATGIDLTDPPAPPAPAATPTPVPGAPAAPEAPAAPDAPKREHRVVRVITTDGDGDHGGHHGDHDKRQRVVIVNGERIDIPDDAEIMAMVPDIQSGHCKDGDPNAMTVQTPPEPGKRQVIRICVNRIEAQAGHARHMGMQSAMAGLRHARIAVEADTTLSADEKAKALRSIDDAIRELQQDQKDD
ncbi:M56 family metallopeptidase [Sphingomonas sp. LB-2]|uniref:M56 family metallopeptidase n=1 Tax=Sphingomonas caeni TaxID=2984949 RepID=UPI00222EDEEA|nr:M56 family metallopeptidase [Sphingomonas caeni]MCW3845713.1 M56 family metallopeptidase [Sphingomonas caeni]